MGKRAKPPKHDPELYKVEKLMGVRQKNGLKPIQKLRPVHRQIIALHVQGYSNERIAEILDMSAIRVCHVLTDDHVKDFIGVFKEGWMAELAALGGKAVDAVRTGLESADTKTALSAADKYFRTQGLYDKKTEQEEQTAEDVIAAALQVAQTNSDTIQEIVRSRRPVTVIDTTAKEIPSDGGNLTHDD